MHFDAFTALVQDTENPLILMEGRRSIPEPAAGDARRVAGSLTIAANPTNHRLLQRYGRSGPAGAQAACLIRDTLKVDTTTRDWDGSPHGNPKGSTGVSPTSSPSKATKMAALPSTGTSRKSSPPTAPTAKGNSRNSPGNPRSCRGIVLSIRMRRGLNEGSSS